MASTSGISAGGGALDVNAIVEKLMQAEMRPLTNYDKKTASFQAKLSAYGALSGSIGKFQASLGSLTSVSGFKSLSTKVGDETILSASASGKAAPGNYNINVSQMAQAQSLMSKGQATTSSSIGLGGKTTLFVQFGSTSGSFGINATKLSGAVLSGGIGNGSLTLNGTAIPTDGSTNSARALADAINGKSVTTGVTAMATATTTVDNLFSGTGDVATGADGTYTLTVGGIQIAAQGANVAAGAGVTTASIDAALAGPGAVATALADANITFTGTAAAGDLKFTRADGSNIAVTETVSGSVGAVTGGIGKAAGSINGGFHVVAGSSVVLSSSGGQIKVGGTNPALAGLTAGSGGSYNGASFTMDATQPAMSVVIDNTNNTLQGIRDAINKAGGGVTASIIADGSAVPNRLVLTSTKTGEKSSMRITLSGENGDPPDAALNDLLGYDPGAAQNMTQTSAAQNTKLTVNGIDISSTSNSISDAIQGVSLTVTKTGTTNLSVNKDTSALKTNIEGFVKAYNELNNAIKEMTAYDPKTKKAGALQADAAAKGVQSQLRNLLATPLTGQSSDMNTLSALGLSIDKSGNMALDNTKLQKAIDQNFNAIVGMFAAIGTVSDPQVNFISSTAATKPGSYNLDVTAMATQGSITSDAALPASVTIASDTTWSVALNDTTPSNTKNISSVNIPAGTYSREDLAKVVQSAINGVSTFSSAGSAVAASINSDGKLVISSAQYGSDSNISFSDSSGTSFTSLFGSAGPVKGTDIAGTIDGQPVTGKGQTMTGASGSPIEGLKIEVTGGSAGSRGTVSFTQGYAYQLNNLATSILDSKGILGSKTDAINNSIKDVAKQREKFTDRLEDIEKRYRAQYSRLDASLARMQSTQNYLSQQLAQIAANR
ncbi:flagellar filament capping protein FliD [Massilia sp. MB5]|uniref:flagellar filament capping protein FliD n=1 Tax=Massilia sp. MB5 TaxID=2919578 RepID=UPI001F0DBA2C|nr:flagellar filament capping protein FliD [Massilia sp. MB5]UMR30730.1 flagellar filament capping protein FliD [Massilia sp. MB5]